jgi:hypothetical protein
MATSTVTVDISLNTAPIAQLEKELAKVQEDIKQIDRGTKAGAEKFDLMSKKAAKLSNALNKANAAAEGFTDDKKFLAADGAIKTMSGTLTGVVGALGLIGVESEAFGEMEKKAASAIAVGLGIKDVSEGFKQLKQSQVLATAAQKAYSVAVAAGSKIMKLFNITMAMNPIGALVAALGIAGGLVFAFRDKILALIETLSGPFSFIIDKIVAGFTKLGQAIGLVDSDETKALKKNIERMEQELAVANAKGEATLQMEKDLLLEKRKLLEEGSQEYKDSVTQELVLDAQMAKEKEDLAKETAAKKLQIQKDNEAKLAADRQAALDKEFQQYKDHLQRMTDLDISNIEELGDIRQEFFEKNLDKEVTNEETRIELDREKQLKRIEELGLNEGLTRQAIFEVNKYYDGLQTEYTAELDQQKIDQEQATEEKKRAIKKESLDTLSRLFGEETALGKVALLAKQAMLVQDMIMTAKSDMTRAKSTATGAILKGAEAQAAIAAGTAETAKIGFPQNIPLLIGYAAQAAGIISTVKSAVGKSKQIAGTVGASSGGIDISSPNVPTGGLGNQLGPAAAAPSLPPQPNMVNQSVRAYVVSGDVNSAQEADARLSRRRSLG